jgi:hypothetical protein
VHPRDDGRQPALPDNKGSAPARRPGAVTVLLRGPLRSRNFRLLAACNVISVAGSQSAAVAIPFAVLRSGGSASDVGYVATAELIAMIGCLLLGGVIADRLPRHHVIMAAEALQALAQGTSAALVLTGHARPWQLAALAAAGGAGFGLYYPAAQGLLPQTVPESQRAQATALYRAGRNAASIGGAALGGLITGLAGPGSALAADAASFTAAAALRAGMRFQRHPPAPAHGMLGDLRDGWREFTSHRWLWPVVTQFTIITGIYAAAMSVLGPLVAHASLGGARSWGLITAAYAAGAVAGGLAMTRYRPRRLLLAAVLAVPAYSLLLFALAVPLPVPLDLAAALVAGGSLEVYTVCWATTMQQEIPPEKLSRVASYDALGGIALTPAATAIAGPAATAIGTAGVLTAGGALVAILPALTLLMPEVRGMRRRQ